MKRGRRILAVFLMMVVLSGILCGGICPGMLLTVSATEMAEEGDEGLTEQEKAEKAEQELQQQVYAMPVESNGWENWPQGRERSCMRRILTITTIRQVLPKC